MPKKSKEERKKKLLARTKRSRKVATGEEKSFFKPDDGVKFWKCDDGDHEIDIIPYEAGPNDPDPDTEEGDYTYVLEVYTHRDIGPEEKQVICLAKTFAEPCPICEHRKEILAGDDPDEDLAEELKAGVYPRSIYNIVCYDTVEEEDKGVQVWHTSHYLFQKHINKLANKPWQIFRNLF